MKNSDKNERYEINDNDIIQKTSLIADNLQKKGRKKVGDILQPDLEGMRKHWVQYQNAGIPQQTWLSLLNELEEGNLSRDYEEALENVQPAEILIYGKYPYAQETLENFICEKFPGDIIERVLISSLVFHFDRVNVQLPEKNVLGLQKGEYYVPEEVFTQTCNLLSEEEQALLCLDVYRGESFGTWYMNNHTEGHFFPMPIIIFNQNHDEVNKALLKKSSLSQVGVDYLDALPQDVRREQYILGTISHEIAHNMYAYLIFGTELEKKWKDLVDEYGNVTSYAEKYFKKRGTLDYDENFAESMRLYTTQPAYLRAHYPKYHDFIAQYFPEIVPEEEVEGS